MGVANIYDAPSFSSAVTTQAILGETLDVLDTQGDWFFIRQWDNYEGWIYHFYTVERKKNWEPNYIYQDVMGWVYAEPSRDSNSLRQITTGAFLPGKLIGENWVRLTLPDGMEGFVCGYEEPSPFASLRDRLLYTAERYLGTTYLWGGKTSLGFDCSGFVQTVFQLNGLQLPRDTGQQVEKGTRLNGKEEIEAGDLIFFAEQDHVSHVAIAYDQNKFIHCSGFVRINTFNEHDEDYNHKLTEMFIQANRIIQD